MSFEVVQNQIEKRPSCRSSAGIMNSLHCNQAKSHWGNIDISDKLGVVENSDKYPS